MAHSLSKLYVHLIFSTKYRLPLLLDSFRSRFHDYLGGILRELEVPAIEMNSEPDHVHILFVQSRTMCLAEIVQEVKRSSSIWLKKVDSSLENFYWQKGYGAFSVSESLLEQIQIYIRNQREHHRKISYQEEYRDWLHQYRIEYDERYVWE